MTPAKRFIMMGFKPENMLVYNPTTWAEWTKSTGVTGEVTGLVFLPNGVNVRYAFLETRLRGATKYGIMYSVIESSLTVGFEMESQLTGSVVKLPHAVGNQKLTFTTQGTISTNRLVLRTPGVEPDGNRIKIKDIRVFELPTGSEIEADFANLTADQLNEKYPF